MATITLYKQGHQIPFLAYIYWVGQKQNNPKLLLI